MTEIIRPIKCSPAATGEHDTETHEGRRRTGRSKSIVLLELDRERHKVASAAGLLVSHSVCVVSNASTAVGAALAAGSVYSS